MCQAFPFLVGLLSHPSKEQRFIMMVDDVDVSSHVFWVRWVRAWIAKHRHKKGVQAHEYQLW